MSNNHFRSSPVDSTLVESSAHYPGRLFLGRAYPATPPIDSSLGDLFTQPFPRDPEVPRIASPGFWETPYDTLGLPCFTSMVCYHLGYPERAGIP